MFRTRRNANRYRNFGLLLVLASFVSLYLGFKTGHFVVFLVGCGFFVGSFPLFQKFKIWRYGAKGEERVAKCLKSLKGRYNVIHDVELGKRGDVDHVVVGPNGVFVIETKNNNGAISCNGDSWSQWKTGKKGGRYKGKLGSPSKQAKRNASLIGNLIRRRLHVHFYVNALVVFANKKATLDMQHPTVPVLKTDELCSFIQSFGSKMLSNKDQNRLAELITSYSRYN
ncbi:MAG: NERD domain-containing protein [Candidatus Bathyarchaeota archaeon]|nr:NERD domain-containing protein [Candidatus Bathyarchaeum sp.]